MKLLSTALVAGAAVSVLPQEQQPMLIPENVREALDTVGEKASSSWARPLEKLQHELKHLTDEARSVWDEVHQDSEARPLSELQGLAQKLPYCRRESVSEVLFKLRMMAGGQWGPKLMS